MAHWAQIDENNIVLQVTVGDNNDPNGDEGYQWLLDNLGGTWVKTSYNATFGKKFAAIGDTYIPQSGNFKPPTPFASWTWNGQKWSWVAPKPLPADYNPESLYYWDETILDWVKPND